MWQQIQDHSSPAGIPALAPPEQQRSEYLRHRIMDDHSLKHARKQVKPKTFDLHVFAAENAQIDQHITAPRKLHHPAGVGIATDVQRQP